LDPCHFDLSNHPIAIQGDAGATIALVKEIENTNKELLAAAAFASSTLDDPKQKRKLNAAVDELKQLIPLQAQAVQQYY